MNAELSKVKIFTSNEIKEILEDIKNTMNIKKISIKEGTRNIEIPEGISITIN